MSSNAESRFRWQAYGGLGEVGMNCMLFRFGDTAIPVDAGILFADPNDLGIESVHPDYAPILADYRPKVWLITHAHEDHIGAAGAVIATAYRLGLPVPKIVAPRFAATLMREKLSEEGRLEGVPHAQVRLDEIIQEIDVDGELQVDDVTVRFIETRHSTADTCSLAFHWKSPSGSLRVVHTSDFKLDPTPFPDGVKDVSIYGVFGGERPDFLFIDSTNSEREGISVSENATLPGLEKLVRESEGRVFVTLFSSNLFRIGSLLAIAGRTGRVASLAGRSLQTAHRIALERGIYDTLCENFTNTRIVDAGELSRQPPGRQMVICSGSQGEYRSTLAKIAQGQHPEFHVGPADTVLFSSTLIPGNERPVSRLINGLLRQGANVLWGEYASMRAAGPVHASGHARREDIRSVMRYLKPRHVVPVHGELRQLRACAEIARESGPEWGFDPANAHVVENGTLLSFEKDDRGWRLARKEVGEAPARILRFDRFSAPSRDPFLWVRKRAAQGGVVVVSLTDTGRYRVSVNGLLPENDSGDGVREDLLANIEAWVHSKFRGLKREGDRLFGNPHVESEAADELARHVRKLVGVRPYVVFHGLSS
jgi:ribonuclease J